MAIRCKNAHYELHRIAVRHRKCLRDERGVAFAEMHTLVENVPSAIANVASGFASNIPEPCGKRSLEVCDRRQTDFMMAQRR